MNLYRTLRKVIITIFVLIGIYFALRIYLLNRARWFSLGESCPGKVQIDFKDGVTNSEAFAIASPYHLELDHLLYTVEVTIAPDQICSVMRETRETIPTGWYYISNISQDPDPVNTATCPNQKNDAFLYNPENQKFRVTVMVKGDIDESIDQIKRDFQAKGITPISDFTFSTFNYKHATFGFITMQKNDNPDAIVAELSQKPGVEKAYNDWGCYMPAGM